MKRLYFYGAFGFTFISIWCVGDLINNDHEIFNFITGIGNVLGVAYCLDKYLHIKND